LGQALPFASFNIISKQKKHDSGICAPGQRLYSQRIATVEPVFANLRHHKRLNRFTLRGKAKVSTQWQLWCLVHNIEKIARFG
jgi:hypothetical protein